MKRKSKIDVCTLSDMCLNCGSVPVVVFGDNVSDTILSDYVYMLDKNTNVGET